MKRSDLIFAALLVPIDFCMILTAGLAAYVLRFQTLEGLRPVIFEIPLPLYVSYLVGVSLFTLLIFSFSGLYSIGLYRIRNELSKVVTACSTSIMAVIVFIFFIQELFSSRFIVLAGLVCAILFVSLARLFLRIVRFFLLSQGVGVTHIALIGKGKQLQQFAHEIKNHPSYGYRIVSQCDHFSPTIKASLEQCVRDKKLEEIIVLDPTLPREELQNILNFVDAHHLSLRYSADTFGGKRVEAMTFAGVPLIELKRTKLEGWGRILKRTFDITISSALLVILSPILFLIAIAVVCESSLPAIYRNKRVYSGGLFDTYKFRTMHRKYCTGPEYDTDGSAEKFHDELMAQYSHRAGPVPKVLNDPRRTCLGRFLERTSLDELPQLANVFLGNMSLVGPRPHMPKEVAGYQQHHFDLLRVKPGLTGLAQISGRSDLDFEDEARLDLFYIQNWSLFLDFAILLKTPFAVLARRS